MTHGVKEGMAMPGNSKKMLTIGRKKAIDYLGIHLFTRVQNDLELLVSSWNLESHSFIAT